MVQALETGLVLYSATFLFVETVELGDGERTVCYSKQTVAMFGADVPLHIMDAVIAHLLPASAIVALNVAIAWKICHVLCRGKSTPAADDDDVMEQNMTSCIRIQLSREGITPKLSRSLSSTLLVS